MKKLLCLCICACLLLVACGKKSPDPTDADNATTGTTETADATETTGATAESTESADPTEGTEEIPSETTEAIEKPEETEELAAHCGAIDKSSVSLPNRTTVDLMKMAIDASTLADTGLKNLAVKSYGTGTFQDYYDLHSNPLYSAEYMLSATALAKQVTDANGFGQFFEEMLAHYGAKIEHKAYSWGKDLDKALTKLFEATGDTSAVQTAKEQAKKVDPQLQKPLAVYLNAVADAYQTIKGQTGKVHKDVYNNLLKFQYYTMTEGDMDTLALMTEAYYDMDFKAVLTAGRDVVRAAGVLANALKATSADTAFVINTPAGDIVFGGKQNDTYTDPNALLLVDLGGSDAYNGRVATNTYENPISVVIDLGGNDTYAGNAATQGCGILGAGVLMDLGGNDTYTAKYMAQAVAIVGVGALYDQEGDDKYTADLTAQSSGHYGMAVLVDGAGSDAYSAFAMSQASAGNCCQAYLVDLSGNDAYYVTPQADTKRYEEIQYSGHSGWNGNNSQGCGWGQRSVETDERGISGGIAGLIDLGGNDKYEGAIWVMGVGYWSGVGFLTDIGGDDTYKSYYYSQSSVAHYGVGLLADIGGNDHHELTSYYGGAGFALTYDRGTTVFINDGGNDTYYSHKASGGSSWSAYDEKGVQNQDMNYAIFIDTEGKDEYTDKDYRSYGYGRGGYFIDARDEDEQDLWFADEDAYIITNRVSQDGGVLLDYPRNDGEAHFWEDAKLIYLG